MLSTLRLRSPSRGKRPREHSRFGRGDKRRLYFTTASRTHSHGAGNGTFPRMILTLLLAAAQFAGSSTTQDSAIMTGARNPAFAADGRLALSVRGRLWVRSSAGKDARWTQLTSGPAWDREPAWTRDGSALIYTSNASGHSQLYRVAVTSQGAAATPIRITTSSEPESQASVAPNGTILFARGRTGQTTIWMRTAAGVERRFTSGDNGAERWPAWSPDGRRVAYSASREDRTRLRVRWVDGDSDRVIVQDRDAEHPAWSPSGDRIAFATRNGRAGVWITTPDASYVNLVSAQRAEPAWSPDGRMLALAELPGPDVGYNGDPDRVGDREAQDDFGTTGRLWFVDAPSAPDASLAASPLPSVDQRLRNATAFAAFWKRMDTLYFRQSSPRHGRWDAMRDTYASRAHGFRTRAMAAHSLPPSCFMGTAWRAGQCSPLRPQAIPG